MKPITSSLFYKTWLDVVNKRKEHLLAIWRIPTEFTPYIKSDEDSVLREIAEILGLKCFPYDYYSIDALLYLEQDLVPNIHAGSTWVRDIRVAFEHENYFNSGLYKEVAHLLITNCDLKVLVTYYPQGDYETELDYLHSIIKGSRQSKTLSDNENFLLIIGAESDFSWDGYVYKEDAWKLLNT